jgi:1,2-diacylglycerol 3-beta-galactosyltransferase
VSRRLLFLIADTGGAHRSFATAVSHRLAAAHPGEFEVAIVDPFASRPPRAGALRPPAAEPPPPERQGEASPQAAARATGLYGPMTVHAPWLWGGLWHASNSRPAAALIEAGLHVVDGNLRRWMQAVSPAAIVTFHPLLGRAAARVRRRLRLAAPVLSVVTDLVDVHALWASPEVDLVIVPSPIALDRCLRNGIPARRLLQVGLPVDPAFRPAEAGEQRRLRTRLDLPPDRFTVLLCGGADGSGNLTHWARLIAASPADVSLIAVCGHNGRAERALDGLRDRCGEPVKVLGFVDNMAEWMRASDVVVTKAGAGTLAEALCCELPLLIVWFIPGQERGNMEWVVAGGAGRYVPENHELLRELEELSRPGSPALAALRAAASRLAQPQATDEVAEAIRSLAR